MSSTSVRKPSFAFTYWRPWKSDSSITDSFLDYVRDTSLASYTAASVGKYITAASEKQVEAIRSVGSRIDAGCALLNGTLGRIDDRLQDIDISLQYLNRNVDLMVEQQRVQVMLLNDIRKLLRIPESEKERQHAIELGCKFYVNAQHDPDLYTDALEELLKAESMMKQDYFVLHRIGCIYLYTETHMDIAKALDYFVKAAKYAKVESDPEALRLHNMLTANARGPMLSKRNDVRFINTIAAESFEKAALSCYILGDDQQALEMQLQAVKYEDSPENNYYLAKYYARLGRSHEAADVLRVTIDQAPAVAPAVLRDLDLANDAEVLRVLDEASNTMCARIESFATSCDAVAAASAAKLAADARSLLVLPYLMQSTQLEAYQSLLKRIEKELCDAKAAIDALLVKLEATQLTSISNDERTKLMRDLVDIKSGHLESMQQAARIAAERIESDRLRIGSRFAGGIVVHVDESGKHGYVCSERDIGTACWGKVALSSVDHLGTSMELGQGRSNTLLMLAHSPKGSGLSLFSMKKSAPSAAELCTAYRGGGYDDWFLPSRKELQFLVAVVGEAYNSGVQLGNTYWSSSEDKRHSYYQAISCEVKRDHAASYMNAVRRLNESLQKSRQAEKRDDTSDLQMAVIMNNKKTELPVRAFRCF